MKSSMTPVEMAFTSVNTMNPTLDDVERATDILRSQVGDDDISHKALDVIAYYIWLQRYGAKY